MTTPDNLPADINRRVESLIRIGTVSAVDPAAGKCRVKTGGLETQWLPWQERREGTTNDWDPPTVGEQCLIFSPSGEPAGGVVQTGLASDAHPPPSHDPNEWRREFPDGTWIHHDHAARHFRIDLGSTSLTLMPGMAILKTPFFLVDAPLTEFTGVVQIDRLLHVADNAIVDANVIIGGNDIAAGAQIDGAGNTNHHLHGVSGIALGGGHVKTDPPPPPIPKPETPDPPEGPS
jgi:phage baseplate assembly protein V